MTNLVTLFDTSKPFPYFFETRAQIVYIIIAGKTIVCVGVGGAWDDFRDINKIKGRGFLLWSLLNSVSLQRLYRLTTNRRIMYEQ